MARPSRRVATSRQSARAIQDHSGAVGRAPFSGVSSDSPLVVTPLREVRPLSVGRLSPPGLRRIAGRRIQGRPAATISRAVSSSVRRREAMYRALVNYLIAKCKKIQNKTIGSHQAFFWIRLCLVLFSGPRCPRTGAQPERRRCRAQSHITPVAAGFAGRHEG
jgi:hypothetical protein